MFIVALFLTAKFTNDRMDKLIYSYNGLTLSTDNQSITDILTTWMTYNVEWTKSYKVVHGGECLIPFT